MNTAQTPPISYTVAAASDVTGMSEYRIRDAINKGNLYRVKDGASLFILHEDLMDWMRSLRGRQGFDA